MPISRLKILEKCAECRQISPMPSSTRFCTRSTISSVTSSCAMCPHQVQHVGAVEHRPPSARAPARPASPSARRCRLPSTGPFAIAVVHAVGVNRLHRRRASSRDGIRSRPLRGSSPSRSPFHVPASPRRPVLPQGCLRLALHKRPMIPMPARPRKSQIALGCARESSAFTPAFCPGGWPYDVPASTVVLSPPATSVDAPTNRVSIAEGYRNKRKGGFPWDG